MCAGPLAWLAGSEKVAAAALAAAEANGAVPPLSARQREALRGALARAAAAFQSADESDLADFTGDIKGRGVAESRVGYRLYSLKDPSNLGR